MLLHQKHCVIKWDKKNESNVYELKSIHYSKWYYNMALVNVNKSLTSFMAL